MRQDIILGKAQQWRTERVDRMYTHGCHVNNDVEAMVDSSEGTGAELMVKLKNACKNEASFTLHKEWLAFSKDEVKFDRVKACASDDDEPLVDGTSDSRLKAIKLRLACLGACQALGRKSGKQAALADAKSQFDRFNLDIPSKLGLLMQTAEAEE